MTRPDGRMGGWADGPARLWAVAVLAIALSAHPPVRLAAQDVQAGKVVYDKWCAECHGETGAGDGSAAKWMLPPPRDFTRATYQIRTTASGELPTDADIMNVVDNGMPGTAMPGWSGKLSAVERRNVVAYVKSLSTFFEGAAPQAIALGKDPGGGAEAIAEGRQVFEKLECFKCHGQTGRGDGQSSPTLKDDWDFPIRAADLTQGWLFTGGNSVQQIYTRMRTGLDGTPMPSFSDAVDAGVLTDEQLWKVAHYVRSLSPERPPQVRDVIRAFLLAGGVPAGPADTTWTGVERFWVPLVGQIVIKPRWFIPSVTGVWVQAVHNGQELAVRFSWTDRSQSPERAWDEWLGRVVQGHEMSDAPVPDRQGPDRLWVQFPKQVSDEAERPFFLGGTTRRPVYLWRWTSAPDAVEEGSGTGFGQFAAASGDVEVTHGARYDAGEWQVQFTRALVPGDSAVAPVFAAGEPIPIAFFAADGSNGETETRGAVSAWYAIYLDVPTPPGVYVAPVVAVLLTAGLALMVVWRAQKQSRT